MHTTTLIKPADGHPEIFKAWINHNGDWSGDARVAWVLRGSDPESPAEVHVPGDIMTALVKLKAEVLIETIEAALRAAKGA